MKKKLLITAVVFTAVVIAAAVVISPKDKLMGLLPDAVSGPLETHKGSVSQNGFFSDGTDAETTAEETTELETTIFETTVPQTEPPVTAPPVTEPPVTEPPVTEPPVTEPPVTEPITIDNVPQRSPEYFDSSLFIGDSRTVGLRDFADLGKATVFASRGMNVFRIVKESVDVPGYGNAYLTDILNAKKYDKIYVMLGINEIGYNPNAVIKKYAEIIDMVKAAQPEAKIYIQANLHITALRSNSDEVYNNTKLNALNDGIKTLANGTSIVYMDANVIFDDESGCLDEKYASDNFHLFAKYYPVWANWIAYNS